MVNNPVFTLSDQQGCALSITTDRLIGNDDAALQQHLLDQTKAQRKPEIQPDCMGDYGRGETMALVADRTLAHGGELTERLQGKLT